MPRRCILSRAQAHDRSFFEASQGFEPAGAPRFTNGEILEWQLQIYMRAVGHAYNRDYADKRENCAWNKEQSAAYGVYCIQSLRREKANASKFCGAITPTM